MSNPFLIEGPAVISFSGGRTSAYMLRRILDAGLQPDVHVMFANTGKERDETLAFVHECGERWDVEIQWLEYVRMYAPVYRVPARAEVAARAQAYSDRQYEARPADTTEAGFREVTFETASRNGEPFENVIDLHGLPNLHTRLCTKEMKTNVLKKAMRARGYDYWDNVLGIRADEPKRLPGLRAPTGQRWENVLPLAEAGIVKSDVLNYWAHASEFDLQLPVDPITGDTVGGNCDLCFLKGIRKRRMLAQAEPARVHWWAVQEARTGQLFRDHSDTYEKLKNPPAIACALPFESDLDDFGDCFCHE